MSSSIVGTESVALDELLSLQQLSPQHFRAHHGQSNRNGVVYGGQLLGQALCAAQLTVEDSSRSVHVVQGSFERAARADLPIDYLAESTLDGGVESVRLVRAQQAGQTLLTATVAFGRARQGIFHARTWKCTPPPPEDLPTLECLRESLGAELSVHGLSRTRTYPQVEVRPVDARRHLLVDEGEACSRFWIRACSGSGSLGPSVSGVLAYLSDYLAVNAALAGHVAELPDRPMFVASLNHSIWFHADPEPWDWLYHELESPWAGDGRALCLGSIYSRGGKLLASVAQETLLGIRRELASGRPASGPSLEVGQRE